MSTHFASAAAVTDETPAVTGCPVHWVADLTATTEAAPRFVDGAPSPREVREFFELYWRGLTVRDFRDVTDAAAIGIRMDDHHTAAQKFHKWTQSVYKNGCPVEAEWRWMIPPVSGSASPLFHEEHEDVFRLPNLIRRPPIK